MPPGDVCPCGLPAAYAECCGRFHRGASSAPTAEALMRSRYSAFVVGDTAYLRSTWDPSTRPEKVEIDPRTRWTGLDVLARTGGLLDTDATVTFRAHHEIGVVAECSHFRRTGNRWLYTGPA